MINECFNQCTINVKIRTAVLEAGGRLNIKMLSYQYRDSHVKDKTVSPTVLSLTWESPYLGKTVFILRRGPGGILSFLNAPGPFWSRSWKFPNIASQLRLDVDRCPQVYFLPMRTTATDNQHCYYALELSIRMPCKRHARRLNRTWSAEL